MMTNPIIVDLIILSYAKNDAYKELTENCIASVINSEIISVIQFNIIVVETNRKLLGFKYSNASTIFPATSFGYNKFINYALKYCNSQFICACNNDLTFHKNWATNILNAFKIDKELYSASPICPNNHKAYSILPNTGVKVGYRTAIELTGWCLFFKREILMVKPFDENFKFWYCDNDYGKTLEINALKHGLVTESIVDHQESMTLKTESQKVQNKLTKRAFLYFDYKWNHKSYLIYFYRLLRFDYPILQNVSLTFLRKVFFITDFKR